MQWKSKIVKKKVGDTRIVNKFLLFPKTLPVFDTGIEITKWLEFANIKQTIVYRSESPFGAGFYMDWDDSNWADKKGETK
jgi:hypothetical protein